MDRNLVPSQVADLIASYVFEDFECSRNIIDKAASFEQLNKLRETSKNNLLGFLPELKFSDNLVKLGSTKKLMEMIAVVVDKMSDEEIETFLEVLEKDVANVKKLSKAILKNKKGC